MASAGVRIGCSGWQYQSWREVFYPPRTPQPRWLAHYASVFDTVEVNSTFYRLAKREAVARWVGQVVAFDLAAAKLRAADTNADGSVTTADLVEGDKVVDQTHPAVAEAESEED